MRDRGPGRPASLGQGAPYPGPTAWGGRIPTEPEEEGCLVGPPPAGALATASRVPRLRATPARGRVSPGLPPPEQRSACRGAGPGEGVTSGYRIPSASLLERLARACGVDALRAAPAGEGTPGRVWLLAPPGAEAAWVVKLGAAPREAVLLQALAEADVPVPRVVARVADGPDLATRRVPRHSALGAHGRRRVPGRAAPPVGERRDASPTVAAGSNDGSGRAAAGGSAFARSVPASPSGPRPPGAGGAPRGEPDPRAPAERAAPLTEALCMARLAGESLRARGRRGDSVPLCAWGQALAAAHAPGPSAAAARVLGTCRAEPWGEGAEAQVARWVAELGQRLPVDVGPMLAQGFSELPPLARRADATRAADGVVLCHGDPTLANALALAHAGDPAGIGPVALVDWEKAHTGWPEEDAAAAASDLFAVGWSGLAAIGAAEAFAAMTAGPGTGARLAFWLVARTTAALVEAVRGDGSSPAASHEGTAPLAPRAWAAYLGLVLARIRLYGI